MRALRDRFAIFGLGINVYGVAWAYSDFQGLCRRAVGGREECGGEVWEWVARLFEFGSYSTLAGRYMGCLVGIYECVGLD